MKLKNLSLKMKKKEEQEMNLLNPKSKVNQ
jgi:hypothetical protein